MTPSQTIKTAADIMCDRLMDVRRFPYVDSAIADSADQIVLGLIEQHRDGNPDAAHCMVSHADKVIDHLHRAGFGHEDEVFLAEIAIDEMIAAELLTR